MQRNYVQVAKFNNWDRQNIKLFSKTFVVEFSAENDKGIAFGNV